MSDPVTPPQWTAVGQAADWADNKGKLVQIGARRIGVYRHKGQWFALKDMCPHAGVALHHGPVHEGTVLCVGHGWLFSLLTGEVTRGPTGVKVATYPVRVSADTVEVEV